MGCCVYWTELSEEKVTLGDVKRFCQLKKLSSSEMIGALWLTTGVERAMSGYLIAHKISSGVKRIVQ